MSISFTNFCRPSLILRLLVGGWLAFISHSTPAQAQIAISGVLAQRPSVYDELPPIPPSQVTPFGNELPPPVYNGVSPTPPAPVTPFSSEPLPPLPTDTQGYTTPQVNTTPQGVIEYQAEPLNRNYQSFERYLVYVDSNDFQTLQQVRQIEPKAYIRQFQGRSVIQVGVFGRQPNAQQRVRQLQSYGINSARLVSFSNGFSNGQRIPSIPDRGNSRRGRSRYYYVAIPASSQDLLSVEDRIRRTIGQNTGVVARNNPRGSHVAVGPFPARLQAEQWNTYLRNLGFGNARVYYGR